MRRPPRLQRPEDVVIFHNRLTGFEELSIQRAFMSLKAAGIMSLQRNCTIWIASNNIHPSGGVYGFRKILVRRTQWTGRNRVVIFFEGGKVAVQTRREQNLIFSIDDKRLAYLIQQYPLCRVIEPEQAEQATS